LSPGSPDWDEFALLLIDVQGDFWNDDVAAAFPDFPAGVRRLLETCRRSGIDVVHLEARFRSDRSDWMTRYRLGDSIPCIDGTAGAEVLDFARAEAGEPVIVKQSFDGFLNPLLEETLESNGKRFLFVAGLVTSVCVLLTAAAAAQRGYLVAVIEDCCADLPAAHAHTLGRYPFVFSRASSGDFAERYGEWRQQLDRSARGNAS